MRVFTDLNLHGDSPERARPEVGEWGPVAAWPTRKKRHARIIWIIAFVVIVTLAFVFGWYVYGIIMNPTTAQ